MNLYGTIILTDPVFFDRIGLYFLGMTFGPSRYSAPALEADQIPKPDVVLISHAHMDHMDYESLLHITDRFPDQLDCITAYNTADVISDLNWKSLTEIDWGEDHAVHGTNFHAVEVKHFGWRYPWEKDRSRGYMNEGRSYNAYIISKNGKKIFFGGDTAYCELFNWAKQENIDIAIMPVGAYNPWRTNHCNPEEALIMSAEHMNAKIFIPIHCNTFRQGREPIEEPMNWLLSSSINYDIELGMKNIGQTLTIPA
jgi:L-ascorbate metabolism protein UlaG (beta-lactamase superfamily)